jgi:hypothetical protein
MRIRRIGIVPLAFAVVGCSFEPQYNAATESEAAGLTSGRAITQPRNAAKPRNIRADPKKPPKPPAGGQIPGKRSGNFLEGGQ